MEKQKYTQIDFSRKISILLTFAIAVIVAVVGILNAVLGYSLASSLGSFAVSIICFTLLGFQLNGKLNMFSRWFIVLILLFAATPYFWIVDGGIDSGYQYFFPALIMASAILLKDVGRNRVFIVVLLGIAVLLVMVGVEHYYPEKIIRKDEDTQLLDFSLAIMISNVTIFLGIQSVLKEYDREKIKADKLSVVDDLTQTFNRRYMIRKIQEAIDKAERYENSGFSIVLLDIDDFKTVNDTYGHNIGDDAIVHLSDTIKKNLRKSDQFARWGGEEFIILIGQDSLIMAGNIAERFRKAVAETPVNEFLMITFSAGVAHYEKGDDTNSIVSRADKGLYQSKKSGKNRITTV